MQTASQFPLPALWMIRLLLAVVGVTGLLAAQDPADAAFPGANGRIAFVRGNSIYVMNADGSLVKRLTSGSNPKWSPDGRKIAFESVPIKSAEIYTMNADGSRRKRLTKRPGTNAQPTWSHDGRKIAFASGRVGGSAAIYVMRRDGKGIKRLPAALLFRGAENPVWSPNGRNIAFQSVGFREIFTVNAKGADRRQLTDNPPHISDADPDWSPDSRKIAFASNRDTADIGTGSEIYIMSADGSGQTRITNSPEIEVQPAWSPNGRKIAFAAGTANALQIYTMNADGTGRARLIQNASSPDWQPVRRP